MENLLTTHDLALAAKRAGRIAVMHADHVVECAPTAELLTQPRHPYTRPLIAAMPDTAGRLDDFQSIAGIRRTTSRPLCWTSPNCRATFRPARAPG